MNTPVDSFPVGWFSVGPAAGLSPGEVRPVRRHGRDLVLWRDADGAAHVLDAYCVHLGAHLGYGGRVIGGTLRCPFHAWRYDGDGRCAEIPYSDRSLGNLPGVRSYPVEERSGQLMAWISPDGSPPRWRLPELPQLADPDWTSAFEPHTWQVATYWREIAENGVDLTHFHYLHGVEGISELVSSSAEGPVWRSRTEHQVRTPLGSQPASFDYELHGPGYGWLRFAIENVAEVVFLITIAPLEDRLLELTFHFLRRKTDDPVRQKMTGALVQEVIDQVTDDVPIWTHKIIKDPPMLAKGDGPIAQLRRWSAAFDRPRRFDQAASQR
jgi:phenylpropionate dioxygenase-like ring-hydroxylating dioxygenase large terminal subunit